MPKLSKYEIDEINFFISELKKPGMYTLVLQLARIVEPNLPVGNVITDASFMALGYFLYKVFHTKDAYKTLIEDRIKSQKEYAEVLDLYKILIKDYADFIRMFNFSSSVPVNEMYQLSLKNGYLSWNRNFHYQIQRCGYEVADVLGAKVTTGVGVCRHISGFLVDIYKELGYESYNASGIVVPKSVCNGIEVLKCVAHNFFTGAKVDGHAFTMVIDNGKKVIYDPTNETFSTEIDGRVILTNKFNILLDILYNKSVIGVKSLEKGYEESLKRPTMRLTNGKVSRAKDDVAYIYYYNTRLFEAFYREHRDLYCELANSYDTLAGVRHGR